MKRHAAAVVVAGWGLSNGVLLTVLAVYGEASLVYGLWGSVAGLLEVAALLVLLSSRTEPEQHTRYRLPRGGAAAVLPAAAGITLAALAYIYGRWLLALAVPLLGVAAALAVRGASTPGEG